ncbi:MAG TPA: NAD(P)-dependent oxidoreductase [Burkholderiales bacterium]|nr:NAD(P)-dependent oxidoreductase [Burkholderiales bacterium]
MELGFIGLGKMGTNMATRLCQSGFNLTVYNRSRERLQALIASGAKDAKNIADVCNSDVVFTMLANDEAVEDVVLGQNGVLESLKPNAIHVSCSTISVSLSAQLFQAHTQKHQGYVSAPVFGRPDAAGSGKLFMIVAGKLPLVEKIQPLFDVLGQRTFIMSESPEQANLVKLSGNFLLASVIESLGEAMALVEKGGINRHQYLDLLTSSLFNIPVYRNYGTLIADRHFEPAGFAAKLGRKDIKLALAAAEELNVPLPIACILRERFTTLAAQGKEHMDWSAIGSLAAKDSALIP